MAADSANLPFPGLPLPNPTISYWQSRTRSSPLLSHRSTEALPERADAVVIGSGFSGAMVAHTLLHEGEGIKTVVMLEAREFCSGATARNGGHTRPIRFGYYLGYKKLWGAEQAVKILHHERDNYKVMQDLCKGIDCEAEFHHTYDVYLGQDSLDNAKNAYAEFVKDGGDVTDVVIIDDPAEAAQVTRIPEAIGASRWPSGSLFPFKLVEGLVTPLLKRGLNLQTYTPALSVTASANSSDPNTPSWTVSTPRGLVTARVVIHATNAFAATLLPQLAPARTLEPWRGHCSAHIPPAAYTGANIVRDSAAVSPREGRVGGYYLQRKSDGVFIVGGGAGAVDAQKVFRNNLDDGATVPDGDKHLATFLERTLAGYKVEKKGEGLERTWTGVMGYTKDHVPLVGAVPGLPGQFCCVGHDGHGMARIATAARATALLALGHPWSETGMPECFAVTQERLEKEIAEDMAKLLDNGNAPVGGQDALDPTPAHV